MLSLWSRLRQPAAACLLAATLAVGACSHPQAARLEPVFCYQTLADIDCYAAPDREDAGRKGGDGHEPLGGCGEVGPRAEDHAVHEAQDRQVGEVEAVAVAAEELEGPGLEAPGFRRPQDDAEQECRAPRRDEER